MTKPLLATVLVVSWRQGTYGHAEVRRHFAALADDLSSHIYCTPTRSKAARETITDEMLFFSTRFVMKRGVSICTLGHGSACRQISPQLLSR